MESDSCTLRTIGESFILELKLYQRFLAFYDIFYLEVYASIVPTIHLCS